MCLVQKTYCMLFLRLSRGGCHSLPMHLNSNTGKKKKRKANTHLTHLREENKSPRGLQQKILSFLSNRFGLIIFFFFLFFLCPVNSNVDSIGVHFVDHIQTHRLSSSILQCCPRRAWSMLGVMMPAYRLVHARAVSMALLSFFFHCSATSFARGSSGLGALNNAWIDSNTVRICRAGDHLSFKMSKHILPSLSTLGW